MSSFVLMQENVIITNLENLEILKKAISEDGAEKLHVITDFDRTLTTAFVNGKKVSSLISVLRDENYLTEGYSEKAKELFKKYNPIETSSIPLAEKKKMMYEWWTKHFELLIKSGLNKKDLESVVKSGKVKLRKGALEFIDFLHKHDIPLVILSSSGLGIESISMYLENEKRMYNDIYIISNSFEWDKEGYAIKVGKPIIHSMNKDETSIKDFPLYRKIRNRKNVLLLGDTLEDIGMIKGFKYDKLIKVGFLNEDVEKNLEKYKEVYDIVILNDGSMGYINKLLKEIVK